MTCRQGVVIASLPKFQNSLFYCRVFSFANCKEVYMSRVCFHIVSAPVLSRRFHLPAIIVIVLTDIITEYEEYAICYMRPWSMKFCIYLVPDGKAGGLACHT